MKRLAVVVVLGLVACGGGGSDHHDRVVDAVNTARAAGVIYAGTGQSDLDGLVDAFTGACDGDDTATASVRLMLSGTAAPIVRTVLGDACPDRLAEIAVS